MSDISLTSGMRSSVLALQDISSLFDTTQQRLSTGRAVNSALDDPIKYFSAQANNFQASNFSTLKSAMNEGLQTIQAANNAITSISTLVKNAIALAQQAQAASTTDYTTQGTLLSQYMTILTQINQSGSDAKYGGKDLVNNGTSYSGGTATAADSLTVYFNSANTNSSLTLTGVDSTVVGLKLTVGASSLTTGAEAANTGVMTAAGSVAGTSNNWNTTSTSSNSWTSSAQIQTDINNLQTALTTLQTTSKTLSTNNAVIQARIDFTNNMINTLQQGADKLTLADMNQEGANMLSLQTQQSLATNSMRLSSQASQSVLRLFQ